MSGAAIAGATLMAVITGVTGYQISLVAIALGWMVARALRKATGETSLGRDPREWRQWWQKQLDERAKTK